MWPCGPAAAKLDRCMRGHPFDERNTYWRPDGNRACKECRRTRSRECERRKREALRNGTWVRGGYLTDSDLYREAALARFREGYVEDLNSGCWIWTRTLTPDGYGKFNYMRKTVIAHRAAYYLLVGEVPQGLDLDHLCRVRRCVNPAHLEPVTPEENRRRGQAFAAQQPAS